MAPTVCIMIDTAGKIFGAFTDIPWKNFGGPTMGGGNSFIFTFEKDDLIIFKHKEEEPEVNHSNSGALFDMGNIFI